MFNVFQRVTTALVFIPCLALAGWARGADEKYPTYTDPAKAGIDYELQGEYAGTASADAGGMRWGGQVIALGDGKFDAVGYEGGLPGDGWSRGGRVERSSGELKEGVVKFRGEDWDAQLTREGLAVSNKDGNPIVTLKKVTRQSSTVGRKPPEGARVLFDGSSAEEFENGRLVEENLLGATNCASRATFRDHVLHIEFRTPFMPTARGQARGNSGVYVQSRYEVQVLDSFGLEGANNECGGIYSIAQPRVNMCYPPLTWQTYDIDFTAARYDDKGQKTANARVTIRHNGVVIHDNLELTHGTPGRLPEGPEPAGLFLQDHGNPVVFRNIWVMEKK